MDLNLMEFISENLNVIARGLKYLTGMTQYTAKNRRNPDSLS
jgi:hypothetical protein